MNNLYEGQVQVYLEGLKALQPVTINDDEIIYYIGSEQTNLIIKDFRSEPNWAAKQTLNGEATNFADIFNQPAWVEICETQGKIEISMQECSYENKWPILWMGVIRDGQMPVHKIDWEILRAVDLNTTAFAALVEG